MTVSRMPSPPAFLSDLSVRDPLAQYWLARATTQLRREICWIWHERDQGDQDAAGRIPPAGRRVDDALDHAGMAERKRRFFERDETAAYLSDMLRATPPELPRSVRRGSFSWVAREFTLSELDCFALALTLLPAIDYTSEAVIGACANDNAPSAPTLAVLQRLWPEPGAVLAFTDSSHVLFRFGLLQVGSSTSMWDAPLTCPSAVWAPLLDMEGLRSEALVPLDPPAPGCPRNDALDFTAARLAATPAARLRVLPLSGAPGAPFAPWAAAVGHHMGCAVMELTARPPRSAPVDLWLAPWITRAWLEGAVLYLGPDFVDGVTRDGQPPLVSPGTGKIPATVLLATTDRQISRRLVVDSMPMVEIPPCTYHERLRLWIEGLRIGADDRELMNAAADCARRFRFEPETVIRLSAELRALDRRLKPEHLVAACRHDLDLGELAQRVQPRFELPELVLPARQHTQIAELIEAMHNLTRVHYEWGSGRAWGEGGLTALFFGPPGTGKTMAAEAVSRALDLPMYRIDLSQVVNKYIGETEKNLRRLFDAADTSDVVLFFDEADSLFGRRTEVRDAHDRYANLEVSYLLERMERFKGLAILATNRRKDLDDAFTRRLRFVIDFPLPDVAERERIWRGTMPSGVDCAEIDFAFLARQFPFAGGHIRSIVFHACLQTARYGSPRRLTMASIVAGIKREYEKVDRAVSLDAFGPWATFVREQNA